MGGTPYDGLYGEAPPERGIFFRLQVYERVGISLDEVYEGGECAYCSLSSIFGGKNLTKFKNLRKK